MKTMTLAIIGAAAAICMTAPAVMAGEGHYYKHGKSVEMENYMEYEAREPCQNYRMPPEGFFRDGCRIMRQMPVSKIEPAAGNEMAMYKVNFDYDQSMLGSRAGKTLDQVAYEIKQANPRSVTISGYTDTAGSHGYNEELAAMRAKTVSRALMDRGVSSQVLNVKAHGENNLAVETSDGVPMRENRRATIEFMK